MTREGKVACDLSIFGVLGLLAFRASGSSVFGFNFSLFQLIEGAESVGSWPALGEVAQKARKDSEKESKPLVRGESGGGGEEGEGGKVAGKEKRGGSGGGGGGGGGGGERKTIGGGGTVGSGGGGGAVEKGGEGEANGDSQKLSSRRKGIYTFHPSCKPTSLHCTVYIFGGRKLRS